MKNTLCDSLLGVIFTVYTSNYIQATVQMALFSTKVYIFAAQRAIMRIYVIKTKSMSFTSKKWDGYQDDSVYTMKFKQTKNVYLLGTPNTQYFINQILNKSHWPILTLNQK